MSVASKDPAYQRRHYRVYKARGKAARQVCVDCGEAAREWSQRHGTDGESPDDYDPRCRRCHAAYDDYGPLIAAKLRGVPKSDAMRAKLSDTQLRNGNNNWRYR